MGLLDGMTGNLLGQLGSVAGQQNPLMQIALQFLQGQQGGLAGLVQRFQGAGLQQQVASWVGTGENLPITGGQLAQALGGDTIAGFAKQLGMPEGQVSGGLAGLLPQLVDKLTPNGAIDQGAVEQQLGSLMKALGR